MVGLWTNCYDVQRCQTCGKQTPWLQRFKPPTHVVWGSCVAVVRLRFHTTARAWNRSCVVTSITFSHRATTSLSPHWSWLCLPLLAAVRQPLLLYFVLVMLSQGAHPASQLLSWCPPCSSSCCSTGTVRVNLCVVVGVFVRSEEPGSPSFRI